MCWWPLVVGSAFDVQVMSVIGVHLWLGWTKTVMTFAAVPSAQKKDVAKLGQKLSGFVVAGYLASATAAYVEANK
jgi:hypothetical protein